MSHDRTMSPPIDSSLTGKVRMVRVAEDRTDQRLDNFLFGQLKGSYWVGLVTMAVVSALGALATAAQPLMLAPALDATLLSGSQPARSLRELSLNNVGSTLMTHLGLAGGEERLPVILAASGLYLLAVILASLLSFISLQMMR